MMHRGAGDPWPDERRVMLRTIVCTQGRRTQAGRPRRQEFMRRGVGAREGAGRVRARPGRETRP